MFAKRILVPLDHSDCSRAALGLAVDLANAEPNTSIVAVHVVEAPVPAYDADLGVLEPEALRLECDVSAASRNRNVRIDTEIRYGLPSKQILACADDYAVDLIVMGTHGDTGIVDILVGHTADEVMRQATCPVLTIRADTRVPGVTTP